VLFRSAEYKTYLKKYPYSEGVNRVKQRLNALLTVFDETPAKLEKQVKKQKPIKWQHFGTFIQFFDYDLIDTERFGSITAGSLLSTNLNYTSRLLNSDYRIKTNIAGSHIYDLENEESDDSRVTSFYIDMLSPDRLIE